MRCKYCGGPIPPPRLSGRGSQKTVYCSLRCGDLYRHLAGRRSTIEHCTICGHVILRGKCKGCGGKPLNGGLAYLVLAIFRQAEEDGALGEMVSNGVAAELIGADPDYLKRLYMKGETR